MKARFYLPTVLFAAVLPLLPAARARSFDMVAIAEQTKKGTEVQPPMVGVPAYYVAYDGGYIESGDPIAGQKPPTAAAIGADLREALASQGYQPAPAQGSPSLLLIYHWGSINISTMEIPRITKLKPNLRARIYLGAPTFDAATLENFLLARRAGPIANDWAPVPGFLTPRIKDALDLAQDDRYFVIVSAYDFAAVARREPALLWRVKLSARSVVSDMDEVLPALLRGGAQYFGRNFPDRQHERVPLTPAPAAGPAAAPAPMPAPPPEIVKQLDAAFVGNLVGQEHELFTGDKDATDPGAMGAPPPPPAKAAANRVLQPPVPPTLASEISGYRQEKLALQEALAARIKAQPAGADSRAAIDRFNRDYAERIAALTRARESIRDQLSKLASANNDPAAAGPLNALLQDYASDVQVLEPLAGGASR